MEGRIESHVPGGACHTIAVMSTICAHCGEPVTYNFLALGDPYYCVVHRSCAPFFAYNAQWPHEHPATVYMSFRAGVARRRSSGSPPVENRMRRRSLGHSGGGEIEFH